MSGDNGHTFIIDNFTDGIQSWHQFGAAISGEGIELYHELNIKKW